MKKFLVLILTVGLLLVGCGATNPGQSVTAAAAAPSPDGSAVFLEGQAIFSEADSMIKLAKTSVLLEMYELGSTNEIKLLEEKAQQGVPVLVLLDGTESQSRAVAGELAAHGVQVQIARSPLIKNGGIEHAKLLVVDDSQLLIGGMNWGRGSYLNQDADVYLTGSSAREAQGVFEQDWQAIEGALPTGVVEESATNQTIFTGQALLDRLLTTLDKAHDIQAALFELSDKELMTALEQRARAGANVQVILDSRMEKQNVSAADALRRAGVKVKMYPPNQVLHAKMLIADGTTLVIGSSNWSYSAFNRNHELDVFTMNPGLVTKAKAAFAQFWSVN